MKINPKRAAVIGLAASTIFTLSGCSANEPVDVYGPPEMMDSPAPDDSEDAFDSVGPTVTPADNEPVEVYGPPEVFEPDTDSEMSPDENEPLTVYGPPEMFE